VYEQHGRSVAASCTCMDIWKTVVFRAVGNISDRYLVQNIGLGSCNIKRNFKHICCVRIASVTFSRS
jgi:hypothetical protein